MQSFFQSAYLRFYQIITACSKWLYFNRNVAVPSEIVFVFIVRTVMDLQCSKMGRTPKLRLLAWEE